MKIILTKEQMDNVFDEAVENYIKEGIKETLKNSLNLLEETKGEKAKEIKYDCEEAVRGDMQELTDEFLYHINWNDIYDELRDELQAEYDSLEKEEDIRQVDEEEFTTISNMMNTLENYGEMLCDIEQE
jgi:hypothetical protein